MYGCLVSIEALRPYELHGATASKDQSLKPAVENVGNQHSSRQDVQGHEYFAAILDCDITIP